MSEVASSDSEEEEVESELELHFWGLAGFWQNLSGEFFLFFLVGFPELLDSAADTRSRLTALTFLLVLVAAFSGSKSSCPLNFFLLYFRFSQISLIRAKSTTASRPIFNI